MKRLACLFLVLCLFISGCNGKEITPEDQAIQDTISKYEVLTEGLNCVSSTLGMFSYYDNYTYLAAKEAALVSDNVRNEYFPSVEYQGSSLIRIEKKAIMQEIAIEYMNDKEIAFFCNVQVSSNKGSSTYIYRMVFNRDRELLTAVTKLGKF